MTIATEPTSLPALLTELGVKQASVEKQKSVLRLACHPYGQPAAASQPVLQRLRAASQGIVSQAQLSS
jgi:hypothetical protein